MSDLHISYALVTFLCALGFLWGRKAARRTAFNSPRRPWVTSSQRMFELFTINQAGRIIAIVAPIIWLMHTAVYLLLLIQFAQE